MVSGHALAKTVPVDPADRCRAEARAARHAAVESKSRSDERSWISYARGIEAALQLLGIDVEQGEES